MIYGYIRVSTKEQNEDRQLIAMKGYNIEKSNIYMDKQSGNRVLYLSAKPLIKFQKTIGKYKFLWYHIF